MGIKITFKLGIAQDLIQIRATDAEGNMVCSNVMKMDRPLFDG